MEKQRVTLLEFHGRAYKAGRYVDLIDGADLEFPILKGEGVTIEAVRIGDWVVSRGGEVSDRPLVLPVNAKTFNTDGTYRLKLNWTTTS